MRASRWAFAFLGVVGFAAATTAVISWNNSERTPANKAEPEYGAPYDPEKATLELHSHLFMDESMGIFFRGSFNGRLRGSWKSRFSSQINPQALERSGIGVLVVALYALPGAEFSLRNSIRRQIQDAENFVHDYPDWIIAHGPTEASRALAAGRRVLVLSLESAHGVLDNEADIHEFVDEKGIRIVTFMHLMDNDLGGVAYLRGYHVFSDVFSWIFGVFHMKHEDGIRVNPKGLTAEGRDVLERLITHHVWIDLSHSSDETKAQVVPIVQAAGQPLLYTHAPLRKYYGAERGITQEQILQVKESGGMIGVVPSEDMLAGTHVEPRFCGEGCSVPCDFGLPALAQQYAEAVDWIGSPDRVAMGSDFNGGIPHLKPGCGGVGTKGLWNIGQVPQVWQGLKALGAPVPDSPKGTIETFLQAWSRVSSE